MQILTGAKREFQQAESPSRHHRVRALKPTEALGELEQARLPPSFHLPPHQPPGPRRPPQLPPVPPRGPRKPNQPPDPQREPELPVPRFPPLLRGAAHVADRARRELQQDHGPSRLGGVPEEAAEAERGGEPAGVAAAGGDGAGLARGEAVPVRQHKRDTEGVGEEEEVVVREAGEERDVQRGDVEEPAGEGGVHHAEL